MNNERIFKIVTIEQSRENSYHDQKTKLEFFIPGVNSGIYHPATLVVQTQTRETRGGFLGLKRVSTASTVVLTPSQFDELFAEMEKIKKFRDTLK